MTWPEAFAQTALLICIFFGPLIYRLLWNWQASSGTKRERWKTAHNGIPLVEPVPDYVCPYCCRQVGYIGLWLDWLFGTRRHGCDFSNVREAVRPE